MDRQAQPRDVRVGIVAFAGSADLVQAPTTNRADALAALEQLALQYNTAIGSGVLAALLTAASTIIASIVLMCAIPSSLERCTSTRRA